MTFTAVRALFFSFFNLKIGGFIDNKVSFCFLVSLISMASFAGLKSTVVAHQIVSSVEKSTQEAQQKVYSLECVFDYDTHTCQVLIKGKKFSFPIVLSNDGDRTSTLVMNNVCIKPDAMYTEVFVNTDSIQFTRRYHTININ